ncbi:MAG: hypothetical protein PVJ38_02460 [Candidatus Bathyarchaeota archaeon]|jgi:DNA-binding transcriptional regulator GbsR (MarR family)
MSADAADNPLLQLQIDYLAFMEQVHKTLGFEANLIGVLFTLLLEGDYITQDRVMELTGFSRSTVSETLKKLIAPSSSFPVLSTRKPSDRRKFYYCPLDFEEYVMTFFTSAMEASYFSDEIIREMLARLDILDSQSREALHMRRFFSYLLDVVDSLQNILEYTEEHLERFFEDSSYTPEFTEEDLADYERKHEKPPPGTSTVGETDSLLEIKRDYIRETLENATPVGRRRELAAVSLALILSPDSLNQEEIMEVTGYSRSTVSASLTSIEDLNVLRLIKKPRDRKKYYKSVLKLQGYGTQKFRIQREGYSQIIRMIDERFLPELRKISGNPIGKERMELFLEKNVRSYHLILDYIRFIHDFMLKRTERFELP